MAACGLVFLVVAVAAVGGCAAPDAVAPQQPAMSASAENQAAEPASDPLVTTTAATIATTTEHDTATTTTLATTTTTEHDTATTTTLATTTTTEHDTATTTTLATTNDTATTTTLATTTTTEHDTATTTTLATTTTTEHDTATTTTLATTTTTEHDTATTTTLATTTTTEHDTATTTTGATPAENQGDAAGPGHTTNPGDPDGQTIGATGQTVPVLEEEPSPSGAEAPAVAAPGSEVTAYQHAVAVASRLAPDFVAPNDCHPPPLDSPYSMPNAPRAYRSGVHAGVDFLCSTPGHPVVAVLSGQVVVAVGGYQDPTLQEWNQLLGVATALGSTPAYTFAMLSGRNVVVDHGIIEDVGHVVSLYAHLDAVDPDIRVGMQVDAGQRLGGIGNTGTRAGVSRERYGQLHLHWNLHIDGEYLGAGLSESETRDVYTELFKYATGTGTEPESLGLDTGTGTHDSDVDTLSPNPEPAEPGTITPAGHKRLTEPASIDQALEAATLLSADISVPNDCQPPPLSWPSALPNAPRPYRSGTHQGIDFECSTVGHPVTAALAGRVVMAVGDFEDPSPQERNQLLDTASVLGATPPYTLIMLYGNHVVVDHGVIDGVGHVVSLYAHLNALETGVRAGLWVEAGQPLGTIGNTGTFAGASGSTHEQLHLHWELHIDGQYLGVGLSNADTRTVYTALFRDVSG